MANHAATKKDIRKNAKRRTHNRYYRKTTRNAMKKLSAQTDIHEALKALPEIIGRVDKLAKKGIIHKNKAAHLKSRLMRKIRPAS